MTAKEGDVVHIEPGFCVWEKPILLDRGVSFSIRGSGTNRTTIASADIDRPLWVRSNSSNVFRISDLNLVGASTHVNGFFLFGGVPPSQPMRGPIHLSNLRMTNVVYRGINIGSGDSFGLIEHCYFETGQMGKFNAISFGGNEYNSWAAPNPLGTTNAVYVENCHFKTRPGWRGNGFFDAYNGAQVVLRYNIFDGSANNGAHGYDSQMTSVRTGELYNNIFTNIDASTTVLDWRGGTLLWFSNAVHTLPNVNPRAVLPLLKYYRGCEGVVSTIRNWAGKPHEETFQQNFQDGDRLQLINHPIYVFRKTLTATSLNREVKIGNTLADSIFNLASCINLDPRQAGISYALVTLTHPRGRNADVKVVAYDANSITLMNILDGSGEFGWPAAFQHGVIGVQKYTNQEVLRYPCYSWGNTINGGKIGFGLAFEASECSGNNNIPNLLKPGRDYFDDTHPTWIGTPANYRPLAFPHPLSRFAVGYVEKPSTPVGVRRLE